MIEWTAAMVEVRLREAMATRRHLAGPGRPERPAAKSWGAPFADQLPRGEMLDRTAEALSWLTGLDPEDARIVRARAEGSPWKLICWRFAVGRATAHRRWQYGLSLITWRLNGRQLPAKRSRRRFLELARASTGM